MKLSKQAATALLALMLASSAFAAHKKSKAPAPMPMPDAAAQQMQEMMKKMQPNENHKAFQVLVGKWDAATRMWMKPGDTPAVSSGTTVNTLVYGGRFLEQTYTGSFNGQPFEGTGLLGYDNIIGQYQTVWYDNFSTGVMFFSGSYDPATKTFTTAGTFGCPMTGEKDRWMRNEWKIVDDNTNVYSSYGKTQAGAEFKSMEITYTRAKKTE
jgi:hypothetical protein